MNKFLRLLVFVVCATFSDCFAQDTLYFDASWKKCDKSAAVFCRVDITAKNGIVRTDYYYPSAKVQMKGLYTSLTPEIKEGDFIWYYENGQIKHSGAYKNGKELGEHNWFRINGTPEAIENYVDGKLDGLYKEYFENGQLSTETTFKQGEQSGYTHYYREDGSLHSEGNFTDGERNGEW